MKTSRVRQLLKRLEGIPQDNLPLKRDGNVDVGKFNAIPLVVGVVSEFKKMGISKDWLFDNGFVSAGVVLRFKHKKLVRG